MKTVNIIMLLITLSSLNVTAATCRSGTAASEGAKTAYQTAVDAINTQADSLKNASEVIGTCISGVTGVVTMPTFPDLGSIWSKLINQVCKSASDKINESYNSVVGDINSNVNELMNGVNNTVNSTVDSTSNQVKDIWN